MHVSLGTFIRERRQDLGLTQEQLAERVGDGVRQSEISRLEHDGVALPRRGRLEQIAAALEVSIGDLMVTTGWLDEEHLKSVEAGPQGKPDASLDGDHGAADAAVDNLVTALEGLAAAQELIAQTSAALEAVEQSIARAQRTLDARGKPRGIVTSEVGLIREWETSATFAA